MQPVCFCVSLITRFAFCPKKAFKAEVSSSDAWLGKTSNSFARSSLFKPSFAKILFNKFAKVSLRLFLTTAKSLATNLVKGFKPRAKTFWLFSRIMPEAAVPKRTLLLPLAENALLRHSCKYSPEGSSAAIIITLFALASFNQS